MKTITVEQFTEEVRKTVGTPFHHGGRIVGERGGIDCGGIIIVALRNLDFEMQDKKYYNRGDGLKDMLELLEANSFSQKNIPPSDKLWNYAWDYVTPGDLVLLRTSQIYHHLVYVTEVNTIIHAWVTTGVNRVVENSMPQEWMQSIHSIWRSNWLQ